MESSPRILLIHEVAILLRVAVSTVYRWLAESRDGRGRFPLPVSDRGKRLRWLASDIEAFLQSQSSVAPLVNVVSATAQRRETKSVMRQREAALAVATATLERHRIGRKLK